MFGTIATVSPKAGMEDAFLRLIEEWGSERGSKIAGPQRIYVARSERDPSVLLLTVLFDTREAYEANAADPEQDRWYNRMVECLNEPPDWHDHEVLLAYEFTPPAS